MTAARRLTALACAGLLAAGCATGAPLEPLPPGQAPAVESDEAGLWMVMDRAEAELRSSGRIIDDPALNAYVRAVLCRLAPAHCASVRVYIVRSAGFNAAMAPNGALQLWTGMLLRVRNEAQLGFVLGHEFAHFHERHSLQRWREVRAAVDSLIFVQFATAVVGLGLVGLAAQFATLGSLLAYSRDQEREADRLGFAMMADAGYRRSEAARIWESLIAEKDADEDSETPAFFTTHPTDEERSETLRALTDDDAAGETGRETYRAATGPFRVAWLRDELRQRNFARFAVMLETLLADAPDSGELLFFKGEMLRLRGGEDDPETAIEAYRLALAGTGAPAETQRSLGLVYRSLERDAEARAAFEAYLEARPDAPDRRMIRSYLEASS